MRRIAVVAAIVTAVALVPSVARSAAPNAKPVVNVTKKPPSIPIYPNAALVREVNVGDQDVLGIAKELLRSVGTILPMPKNVPPGTLETLMDVISGVKHVRIVVTRLQTPKANWPAQVLEFYDRALSKGPWSRLVLDMSQRDSILAVYSLPQTEGLMILKGERGRAGVEITAARSVGRIDFLKLVNFAVKAGWAQREELREALAGKSQPESTVPPAPPPSAGQ